ncbi:hypothetical protein CLF_101149 [Clonorchis sinensis]|uniref:C2H2-type domain-containing protein n=1 Tax=Clonorchis sinensis TaxID=79923 RepID=G7Y549_CLOSI|nr:hypothetical protein CLF_101149 [Clonorchis sinensis]
MLRERVYKIKCNDCIKVYMGQTARELHTRIGEHKRKINRPPINADEYRALLKDSAIAERALDTGHIIDLENVEVLRRGLRIFPVRVVATRLHQANSVKSKHQTVTYDTNRASRLCRVPGWNHPIRMKIKDELRPIHPARQ